MVKELLILFEVVSGLQVNASKSRIFEVNSDQRKDIVAHWNCKIGEFPTWYLGLPLGVRFKSVST